jgi:hypothetical protein
VLVHCHMGISRSATVIAAYCEIMAPWERLKVDRNSPRTSDVESPNFCSQGDRHHQERSLVFLTRFSLPYPSHLQLVLRYSRTTVSSRNFMPMKLAIIPCHRRRQPIAPGNGGTVKMSLAF